jgi:signal transduction histidine kinase
LDQVIYKTTHDLKAPLLSAIGLVNLAEKAPVDQREEYLTLIKRSLFKMNAFIEEMNNFFRNEKLELQREKVEIEKLVKDELDSLKSLFQTGKIKVEVSVEGTSEFFSDSIRVKTIVANILTNAIKYADPDKSLPFIKIKAKVQTDFCTIAFEDNGIGIEEEMKGKIFDLFYRATTQSQGTGIGLFIVKDTVDRLKGKIEVESQIGLGTTFKVQIPNQLFNVAELN